MLCLFLYDDLAIASRERKRLPFLDLSGEDKIREAILHFVLECALERSCSVLEVVSLRRYHILGFIGKDEVVSGTMDARQDGFKLYVHHPANLRLAQLVEEDDIVQTVEKFGAERLVQSFLDHGTAMLLVRFLVFFRTEPDTLPEVFELACTHVGGDS